ncbi:Cro/Cl family transcriptional regulator [Caulobacter sp. Root1455]|uniref:helix-turn-helix domain-containing protein n=1 Tax=Caulobacter sp. Root1455 TaxID=1736465 RepID=UPI0006FE06E6|nr:helix-turn-helix transcriptional regulator [Caulobacter sp. Root1455]KQZ06213.1 Cro/Cl family transcriptional regulator [Caulobacter sp. Root1455]
MKPTPEARPGPHPVDVHVGRAVRWRRKLRGLSQQALAERIGLTFQQVQKYETGTNRISASALHAIARALEVPVAFFFDGLPETVGGAGSQEGTGRAADEGRSLTARMLGAPGGLAMAEAWLDLPPGPLRHRLAALVQTTAAALRAQDRASAA